MVTKQHYVTPDIDLEPMALGTVICESTEDLSDYDSINDFTW